MNRSIPSFFTLILLVPFISALHGCGSVGSPPDAVLIPDGVQSLGVQILKTYPHDPGAYTQGFFWEDGWIYESTGKNGHSGIRIYRPGEDPSSVKVSLPARFFGEGLARAGSKIFQLTWRAGKAFVYEPGSMKKIGEFDYDGEGWGLCHDGRWLIMSDGSDKLTYRDPVNFKVWKTIPVRMAGEPVHYLNELEYVEGFVYANIWQGNHLVKIDPSSGEVVAVIDASSLPYKSRIPGEDVLNGIAYIPQRNTFLLTGKLWPEIYEVRLNQEK